MITEYENTTVNIKPNGMFHTPEDWDELMSWLERLHGSERAVAMTAAVMAWNMAARFDAHNAEVRANGLD